MATKPKKKDDAGDVGSNMLRNPAPIGMLDDGKLNVVDKDTPAWKPKVFDDEGNEIDPDAVEPDAPADE